MDEDVAKGKAKQVEGRVQDAVGNLTGSTEDQAEGEAKKAGGAVQEGFGKAKDAIRDAVDGGNRTGRD